MEIIIKLVLLVGVLAGPAQPASVDSGAQEDLDDGREQMCCMKPPPESE